MLLIKAVFVLCSATAVLAQRHAFSRALDADAVASGALFVGEDTTESLEPLDVFKNPLNHATAASSVLAYSANLANFHPSEKSADSLVQSLDEFKQQVTSFPGFFLKENYQTSFLLKNHTTLEEFKKAIKNTHSQEPNIEDIATKFTKLTPLDLSKEEAEQLQNWILSVIVINKQKSSDIVTIQLVRVGLTIAYDDRPKAYRGPTIPSKVYIPEQRVPIEFEVHQVNSGFLVAYAQNLVGLVKPIVNVETAIDLLTSPERNIPKPDHGLGAWATKQRVLSRWLKRV